MKKVLVIFVAMISMYMNAAEVLTPSSPQKVDAFQKKSIKNPQFRVQRQLSHEKLHIGQPSHDGYLPIKKNQRQRSKTVSH